MQSKRDVSQQEFVKKINKIYKLLNIDVHFNPSGVCFGLAVLCLYYIKTDNIQKFETIIDTVRSIPDEQLETIVELYKKKGNVTIEHKNSKISFKEIIDFSRHIADIQNSQNYKSMMLNWVDASFTSSFDFNSRLLELFNSEKNISLCIHNKEHIFAIQKVADTILYYDSNGDCADIVLFKNNENGHSQLFEMISDNSMVHTLFSGGYYHIDDVSWGNYGSEGKNALIDEIIKLNLVKNTHLSNAIYDYNVGKIPKSMVFQYLIKSISSTLNCEFDINSCDKICNYILSNIHESKLALLKHAYPDFEKNLMNIMQDKFKKTDSTLEEIRLNLLKIPNEDKFLPEPEYNQKVSNYIYDVLSQIVHSGNGVLFGKAEELFRNNPITKSLFDISLQKKDHRRLLDSLLHQAAQGGYIELIDYLSKSDSDFYLKNEDSRTPVFYIFTHGTENVVRSYIHLLHPKPFSFFSNESSLNSVNQQIRNDIIENLFSNKNYNQIVLLANCGVKLDNNELLLLPEKIAVSKIQETQSQIFSLNASERFLLDFSVEKTSNIFIKSGINKLTIQNDGRINGYDWDKLKKLISTSKITECEFYPPLEFESNQNELEKILEDNIRNVIQSGNNSTLK